MQAYFPDLQLAFDPIAEFNGELTSSNRAEDIDDLIEIFGSRPWPQIDFAALKNRKDAFLLLTADAKLFYMPAIAWALEGDDQMKWDVLYDYFLSMLTPYSGDDLHQQWTWANIDSLTDVQKKLIAKSLARISEKAPESFPDQADLARQLYWETR